MKTIILAPHVDDEMIGCWSVLRTTHSKQDMHVVYFYEVDEERLREAEKAAYRMGFTPHYALNNAQVHELLKDATEVYVPSRYDHHKHHRLVNQAFRESATNFYSVDMVDARTLDYKERQAKYAELHACYPSQSALWENDQKYVLFESIHQDDFDTYRTLSFHLLEVTVLDQYADDVQNWVRFHFDSINPRRSFHHVLSIAVQGEVTMTVGKITFKARQTS